MAYIGHDIQYGTISKQTFTANGSTTVFTLDEGVGAASNLLVAVGGVIQEPDEAYTAIGTVLTFSTAPANGATVWAIKLGNETGSAGTLRTEKVTHQTGVGNGTTTPFALNKVAPTSSSIIVALDGLIQKPEIEFTVDGTVLTLSSSPSSSVKIIVYFLTTPNTLTSVEAGSITAAKLNSTGTWPAWNGSNLTNLTAANLTGTLPALDATALTGTQGGFDTKSASDPLITSNKELGHLWLNKTTGELFCCTDATTNNNAWKNVGEGSGNISNVAPTNPTNAGSFVTPMTESTTYNYIFSGATDPDAGDTVTHYIVDQISNAALTVTAAEVAAGQPHAFTAAAVGSDTNVTFRVRAKDNHGAYSSGVTVSMVVDNDTIPTDATNASGFADIPLSTTGYNYTFAGGTDDKAGFSYVVDQISNAALTVSSAEVASGSAHSFNTGSVGSDTAVTFRVRTKDSAGQYSSGVTVSMTVISQAYTTASGGNTISTSGDYKYHIFTQGGTFQVTQAPVATGNVEYLIVGGGGGGGGGNNGGGGGGGGDYVTGTVTPTVTSYNVVIGNGGAAQPSFQTKGFTGNSTSIFGVTSIGGGAGGGASNTPSICQGGNGGSGGGGGCSDVSNYAGSDTGAGQGNAGGSNQGWTRAGGGGGAGSAGAGNGSTPNGGMGVSNSIGGASPHGHGHSYFSAGGGGGEYSSTPGNGGLFGGGNGGGARTVTAGADNTGGGGGGGGYPNMGGMNGGKGIVIVKYKYQN